APRARRPPSERAVEVRHLERGERGVAAAVAAALAAARERLLELPAGEHAEGDRDAGRLRGARDRVGGDAADVVVVVGLAADHRPEADDRVDVQPRDREARRLRELDRAGHLDDGDVAVGDAVRAQRLERALEEARRDEVVEAAAHDGDLEAAAVAGSAMRGCRYHGNPEILPSVAANAKRIIAR